MSKLPFVMTKLQRYEPHIYRSLLEESRIMFEASDTGEWVKATEHLAMVEKMKCCETCKNYETNHYDAPCVVCANTTDLPKWELEK
jgi:NMD protein affecting ribosome stability and mRNA decay